MGAKCSTGMADGLVNINPEISKVQKTLQEMVPEMLDFQVTGNKKDFERQVESFCKDSGTLFVFNDGRVATAVQVRDSAGASSYSKAELVSIDTVSVFADKSAAVSTITVKCCYEMLPGQYEIAQNTVVMQAPSLKSTEIQNIDKGAKVTIDKVVRVGERLRGKLRGAKGGWITLAKEGSDVQFVSLIQPSANPEGELYTYSLVLEKLEQEEETFAWKLVHVTMQAKME